MEEGKEERSCGDRGEKRKAEGGWRALELEPVGSPNRCSGWEDGMWSKPQRTKVQIGFGDENKRHCMVQHRCLGVCVYRSPQRWWGDGVLSRRAWLAWLGNDTLVFRRVASLLWEISVPSCWQAGHASSQSCPRIHQCVYSDSLAGMSRRGPDWSLPSVSQGHSFAPPAGKGVIVSSR